MEPNSKRDLQLAGWTACVGLCVFAVVIIVALTLAQSGL
jgi:hypothetical protein